MTAHSFRSATAVFLLVAAACAVGDERDRNVVRGRGLKAAELSAGSRTAIYDASARAAFDFGPALSLLLHPRQLPRSAGRAGGDSIPAAIAAGLRQMGTVQGTCDAPDATGPRTPQCTAELPGYVVRFSDVLRVSRDTIQVYVEAERYDTPTTGTHQAMRFERAFQLVRNGRWRVVKQARVTRQ